MNHGPLNHIQAIVCKAKGYVATPKGMVYCAWSMKNSEFIIDLKLPENCSAKLIIPNQAEIAAVSGTYKC